MSSDSSRIGDGFEVKWAKPRVSVGKEMSPKEVKNLMDAFTQPNTPLTSPNVPLGITSEIDAIQTSIRNLNVAFEQLKENEQNAAKRKGLFEKMQSVGEFAKKHPWLTTGFVIALILAALATYFTVQAFLGHTTISIFQAQPELGGGLVFMSIYYSVYLINLCRRAKVKDDLEARIHAHNQFTEELTKTKNIDLAALSKTMNRNIEDLSEKLVTTEENLRATQSHVEEQFKTTEKTLATITANQEKLKKLYRQYGTSLEKEHPETFKQLEDAMFRSAEAIKLVSELLEFRKKPTTLQFPSIETIPYIPEIPPLKSEIVIPPQETETMKANQAKQRSLIRKMGETLNAIGPFLKKNPLSTSLLITGLAMCILSGLVLYFYFHGVTDLYFFGSISLTTIMPMVIYGLSLIYEGYNSATLNSLQEELKEIDSNNAIRMKALQEEQHKLEKIKEHASTTFKQFTAEWTKFQQIETTVLASEMEALEKMGATTSSIIEKVTDFLWSTLEPLYPDLSKAETTRVINGFAQGATIKLPKGLEGSIKIEYV